ncbi:MAG: hypothetical protein AAF499_12375 [Pseudomonadota bacterium]
MPRPPENTPVDHCRFLCDCGEAFEGAPERVTPDAERPWHPFAYESTCPACGAAAPQDAAERTRWKAWAYATGPRTEAGKASSAANLAGYPTPAQTEHARFNALKTGQHAQVATFYPAKPGRYPQCSTCPYYTEIYDSRDPTRHCAEVGNWDRPTWCQQKADLWLRHAQAFETGDPRALRDLNANFQWALRALADDMILAIGADGVRLVTPEFVGTKDGVELVKFTNEKTGEVEQVYKFSAHPLLRPLLDLVQKNNMSMHDMAMTERDSNGDESLPGHLEGEGSAEFEKRAAVALEGVADLIQKSRESRSRDPVVINAEAVADDAR